MGVSKVIFLSVFEGSDRNVDSLIFFVFLENWNNFFVWFYLFEIWLFEFVDQVDKVICIVVEGYYVDSNMLSYY